MKKILTVDANHILGEKVPCRIKEDLGGAVLEYMCAPRLGEFVGRKLSKRKDCRMDCETTGGMRPVAARYERDFDVKVKDLLDDDIPMVGIKLVQLRKNPPKIGDDMVDVCR